MSFGLGVTGSRTAATFIAITAIAMAVLHGTIPHHPSPAGCHDCETQMSPALPPPAEIITRPVAPTVLHARPEARPTAGPTVRRRLTG